MESEKMKLRILKVDEVSPNPLQPREAFDREKLKELADTVSDMGVLQPIVVRPKGNRYEIIAGERRWKASQIAGKKEIPAIVKDVPDEEVMVESLIENIHREDLGPIEQAKAILEVFKAQETFLFKRKIISKRIVDERLPQKIAVIRMKSRGKPYYKDSTLSEEERIIDKILKKIGLGYNAIYESLILLRLPRYIQQEAIEKDIGKMELARISSIEDEETQKKVFRKVADEDLSYAKTAKLVSTIKKVPEPVKRAILEGEIEIERVEPLIEVGIAEEKAEELVQTLKIEKAEEEDWRNIELARDTAVLKGDLQAKGIIVEKSVDEKRIGKFRQLYDQIRFLTLADFLQIKNKKIRQQAIGYLAKMEENCHNLRIALEKR